MKVINIERKLNKKSNFLVKRFIKVSLLIWYSSCICPLGGTEWLWSWLFPVLPMQLPCESWVKPVRQRCFRLHVNEPSVFWHWKPIPQLWVRITHSSMSRRERVHQMSKQTSGPDSKKPPSRVPALIDLFSFWDWCCNKVQTNEVSSLKTFRKICKSHQIWQA